MLASGALSPLEGFMGSGDYESVLDEMRLSSGLPWALPVCLAVEQAPRGDRVALSDGTRPVAVLDVEEVFDYDKEREAQRAFRTTDDVHPGVARGDLARDLPQELRLFPLHRRPRPRGCGRLLRHVRRAADLR